MSTCTISEIMQFDNLKTCYDSDQKYFMDF